MKKSVPIIKPRKWKDADNKKLAELFCNGMEKHSTKNIAKVLGRTPASVSKRIQMLKLKRSFTMEGRKRLWFTASERFTNEVIKHAAKENMTMSAYIRMVLAKHIGLKPMEYTLPECAAEEFKPVNSGTQEITHAEAAQ